MANHAQTIPIIKNQAFSSTFITNQAFEKLKLQMARLTWWKTKIQWIMLRQMEENEAPSCHTLKPQTPNGAKMVESQGSWWKDEGKVRRGLGRSV